MLFPFEEIRRVMENLNNEHLAHYYMMNHALRYITVTKSEADSNFTACAVVMTGGYDNYCRIQYNAHGKVLSFTCDCPYCISHSCAHIGALMMKLNQLEPFDLPFLYDPDDMQEDPEFRQWLADMESLRIAKERQMQRAHLERQRMEEEMRRRITASHIARTADLIRNEREQLLRSVCVDQSGSIQLTLVIQGHEHYGYETGLYFRLKLGRKRKYFVKNIHQLLTAVKENQSIRYGKELEFIHHMDAFDADSQNILHFLFRLWKDSVQNWNKGLILIRKSDLRYLYELCEQLPKEYCYIDCEEQSLCMQIKLHEEETMLRIELCNYPHLSIGYLDESGLYQAHDSGVIRYRFDELGSACRLLQHFIAAKGKLLVGKEDLPQFSKYIWQPLRDYIQCDDELPQSMQEESLQLALYGDMDDEGVLSLRLEGKGEEQTIYGFCEQNQEKPLSMELVEQYIYGFATEVDMSQHIAYLRGDDDSVYSFLQDGLSFLQTYCDIYISDAILHLRKQRPLCISLGVRISNQLLELEFDSNEIPQEELFALLRSYRRKQKYHRLNNGQLIALDAPQLRELDHLTNMLQISPKQIQAGIVQVPLYRSMSLAALPEQESGIQISRSAACKKLQERIQCKESEAFTLPAPYGSILRDYQIAGYQWLKLMNHYQFGAILADDMGLGKSVQVIALLESEKAHGFSIIVVPASLIYNWQDEINKFTKELRALCIVGKASQRAKLISQCAGYDVLITSYDYLRRDISQYKSMHFHYAILDEAQFIKNQKSKNAHCVKELKATHRLALSGTPIENSLAELWSVFDFLMPGYLYSYAYFLREYEKPIVKDQDEAATQRLKQLVEPFILRRRKQEVLKELPQKIEQTLMIPFREEEERLYLANQMQAYTQLQTQFETNEMNQIQVLALLTRLRQLCCEPRLVYENVDRTSSKLEACVELCLSLKEANQRILLFSAFTSMLELIEEELRRVHLRCLKLTGQSNKNERRTMVEQFQQGKADVFLISLKAGGTGLNLTAAQAVIHYDPWWNLSAQNQATDRAYRIGQNQNVQVFSLIMKNSIEERIQKLQARKQELADNFVAQNDGSIKSMRMDQIMALFQN